MNNLTTELKKRPYDKGEMKAVALYIENQLTNNDPYGKLSKCNSLSLINAAYKVYKLGFDLHSALNPVFLIPYNDNAQIQISSYGWGELLGKLFTNTTVKPTLRYVEIYDQVKQLYDFKEKTYTSHYDTIPPHERTLDKLLAIDMSYKIVLPNNDIIYDSIYMTKQAGETWGHKYSKTYNLFWGKDFMTMFKKTVFKRLSKSIIKTHGATLQAYKKDGYEKSLDNVNEALTFDQAAVSSTDTPIYLDSPVSDKTTQENKIVEATHENDTRDADGNLVVKGKIVRGLKRTEICYICNGNVSKIRGKKEQTKDKFFVVCNTRNCEAGVSFGWSNWEQNKMKHEASQPIVKNEYFEPKNDSDWNFEGE